MESIGMINREELFHKFILNKEHILKYYQHSLIKNINAKKILLKEILRRKFEK